MSNGDTKSNGWDTPAAVEGSVVASAADSADVDVISVLERENEQLRDAALRAAAEAENTRRRGERAAKDASQYSISSFARELLAVSDNLRRAIEVADDAPISRTRNDALGDGVRATERMLASVLSKFGVAKINAIGSLFDPNFHDAVMVTEDSDLPAGTVVQVLEDGYTIHDRLLRPARVVLAAAKRTLHPGGGMDADRSL